MDLCPSDPLFFLHILPTVRLQFTPATTLYLKAALHFWGTGEGVLFVVSFLFIRDLAIRLGSDCLDACLKGIYKVDVVNCKFVNLASLQHI